MYKYPLIIFASLIIIAIIILIICFCYSKSNFSINSPGSFIEKEYLNCFDQYFDMIVCITIPNRKEYIINVFKNYGIKNVIIFDAFYKDNYDYDYFLNNGFISSNFDEDFLNLGRICCHYSAITVYKNFVDSDKERLLVFEDDLDFNTYNSVQKFNKILGPVIDSIPDDWEYLNFAKCHAKCKREIKVNKYWNKPNYSLCRTCIGLTKSGAKTIINRTVPMVDVGGDKMISRLIDNDEIIGYVTKKSYFRQNRKQLGSNLKNGDSIPTICKDGACLIS